MSDFLQHWQDAALTSTGFFWSALWAFVLGYLISSLIQVLVTERRMQRAMGSDGPRSVGLGTLFGFISSSCSFAALSTTRALFQKGAGLVPSIAFLLASTNLVIELGFVIAIFLSWQFVVGEYLGGVLLILFAWLFIRLTNPKKLIRQAREKAAGDGDDDDDNGSDWKQTITSRQGWQQIGQTYVMEWQMVWRDVLIGFTLAGVISAFVPDTFFQTLFVGSGRGEALDVRFWEVLAQTIIGPVAAFFTFIGSMGNIPLAALLYDHGVSFAGVMAFIFSDLVVLPVLRINAGYYGWRMALYILLTLLLGLVCVSLLMHYGFSMLDMLPDAAQSESILERDFFALNYGFWLNLVAVLVTLALLGFARQAMQGDQAGHQHHPGEDHGEDQSESGHGHETEPSPGESGHQHHHHDQGSAGLGDRVLNSLVVVAFIWLVAGLLLALIL
ncbi:permease [Marinobacterium sp. YM272]|uniref:permease n=1 Tax=Marinobacterium sp. YM272 TaxID=3421654 RepID=UPI003D7FB046